MKKKGKSELHSGDKVTGKDEDTQGYPLYPSEEDIYSKGCKEKNLEPEDISKIIVPSEKFKSGDNNQKDFTDDMSGDDLDLPDNGLYEDKNSVYLEDEENSHYSLGGDNHCDLDESDIELNT